MCLKKQFLKSKPICKVTFTLPTDAAVGAKEVKLLGEFNNWETKRGIPMKKRNGEFKATVSLKKDQEFQFRYLIDGEKWENDWEADKYVPSPYGMENSVVVTSKQDGTSS